MPHTEQKFGTIWYSTAKKDEHPSANEMMLEKATIIGHSFFASLFGNYTDRFGNKQLSVSYASYKNIKQFLNNYLNIDKPVFMCEHYPANVKIAMFGDLEWPLDKWSKSSIKLKFVDVVNHVLEDLGVEKLTDEDLIYTTACDEKTNKGSLHTYCHKFHFSNQEQQNIFWSMVGAHISTLDESAFFYLKKNKKGDFAKTCFIDFSVYTNGRNMRLFNSYKLETDGSYVRPFMIEDSENVKPKYALASFIHSDSINLSDRLPKRVVKVKSNTGVPLDYLQKLVDEYGIDDAEVGNVVFATEHGQCIMLKHTGSQRLCKFSGAETRNKAYLWVSKKKIAYRCHEVGCKDMEQVLWEDTQINDDNINEKLILATDVSLGDVFHSEYSKFIKVGISEKIYIWNQKTLLWDESDMKKSKSGLIKNLLSSTIVSKASKLANEKRELTDSLNREISQTTDENKKNDLLSEHEINEETIKKLWKLVLNIQQNVMLNNIIQLNLYKFFDDTFEDKLDRNPDHMPLANGQVIDLRTLETRRRTNNDYWSFECPVKYLKYTSFDNIKRYLYNLTMGDEMYEQLFQQRLGYMMTGHITDRTMDLATGSGLNGKSELFEQLMSTILNKFYVSCNADVFCKLDTKNESSGKATPELIPLFKARLAVYSEGTATMSLNEARIKAITGGDKITGRQLYGEMFKFNPMFKGVILTNILPNWKPSDPAMVDRIKVLPFKAKFQKGNVETAKFCEMMRTEWIDEAFTYFAQGANAWYKTKTFVWPNTCLKAIDKYINDNDTINEWLDEECEININEKYEPKLAYNHYKVWCQDNNSNHLSPQEFGNAIRNRFGEKTRDPQDKKTKKRVWYYRGFGVKKIIMDWDEGDAVAYPPMPPTSMN